MQAIIKKFNLRDGREISIETGKLAKQADGSVVLRMGNTMLLATVVANKKAKDGVDFLPLSVDYQEKFASAGRIPGSFQKRESRLSDYEVLISRLIDRALRPCFPDDFHADVQVNVQLISLDSEVLPDALAGLAASAAIAVSDIPFNGPISEVRVARINGAYKTNPSRTELEAADLDIIIAGSAKDILMVEGEMKEVSEEAMIEAIKLGHEEIKLQCQAQLELAAMVSKSSPKREYHHENNDWDFKDKVKGATYQGFYAVAKEGNASKQARKEKFEAVRQQFIATLSEDELAEKGFLLDRYFHDIEKEAMRDCVLAERRRLDGRDLRQIRPIWVETDYLPSPHGSAVFTRGETQSLTTVTLGSKDDEQIIDGAVFEGMNNLMLHYNFPGFSTGEVKPNRAPGRREVGHGNLALRGLKQVLPSEQECPYTIRIVSDILESNGSSSMATVCAGSMALMDAGVKMKKPVSGIAMGLISDSSGRYAVLSDILGDEDHLGDMDFKVVGTKDGITACQMDIKVDGLSYQVLTEALEQAKEGRLHILNEMSKAITEPRSDYKPHTPRIELIVIDKEFIGAIIGPGGKIIQEMQRETNTTISIEEKDNKGYVQVYSNDKKGLDAAMNKIKGIVAVPEVGEVYEGVVKNIQTFGAFVEFMPGKDGLLHISELDWKRIANVSDVLKEGDRLKVKLVEVDPKTGKFRLSRKVLLPKPEVNS